MKNCYTTQLFYDYIHKNQNFFKKIKPLPELESITKIDINRKELFSNIYDETRRNTNPQQSDIRRRQKNSEQDDDNKLNEGLTAENSDEILNEYYDERLIKKHFDFLFSQSMMRMFQ